MLFENEQLRKTFSQRLYVHLDKLVNDGTIKTSEEFSDYYDSLFDEFKGVFVNKDLTDIDLFKQSPEEWKVKYDNYLAEKEKAWVAKMKTLTEESITKYTVSNEWKNNNLPTTG